MTESMAGAPERSRVAVVDCGTNSIRLLIAEPDPSSALVDVDRRLEIVRLGQDIDATGEFHPDALARTFAAVERYAEVIAEAGVGADRVRFVATSAARDAGNRARFFDGVQARLGVTPEIISGETEAELSYSGALSRLDPPVDPVLVMDIGGGSTELVIGTTQGRVRQTVSLEMGSVRLTERFLPTKPPTAEELAQASGYVDELLAGADLNLSGVATWIGVAGTVTTMAILHLGLDSHDRERVHGAVLSCTDLDHLLARLSSLPVAEIRSLPTMHPQRADVITAGCLIATRVAQTLLVASLVVSETDLLDGIALEMLHAGGPSTSIGRSA